MAIDSSDTAEITLTLKYDYAVLNDMSDITGELHVDTPNLSYGVTAGTDPERQD